MISSDRLSAARKSFSNTTQITEKPKSPVKIARKMSLVSLKDKPGMFSNNRIKLKVDGPGNPDGLKDGKWTALNRPKHESEPVRKS